MEKKTLEKSELFFMILLGFTTITVITGIVLPPKDSFSSLMLAINGGGLFISLIAVKKAIDRIFGLPDSKEENKQEFIICAAIYYHSNKVFSSQPKNIETGFVLAGWRHFNILPIATRLGRKTVKNHTQGFLTSEGRFVDRKAGRQIAYNAGQVKTLGVRSGNIRDLFSEDLY